MATRDAATPGNLTLTRILQAPRDAVWRAWTEPEHLARWWGPHGFTSRVSAWEVRPGGAIRIEMCGPDGSTHPMSGTFREVAPPERLVFSGSALDGGGRPMFEVLTTLTLAEAGPGRTALAVEVRVLSATAAAAPHLQGAEAGWSQQLERLGAYIEGAGQEAAGSAATFAVASDREIVATRTFDAPRWLVFLALSRPEHLARWWGPRGFSNTIHELDVRPGGAWRITQRAPDGTAHPFAGVYREVVAPERIVYTQRYGGDPAAERTALVTLELEERQGRTTLTTTVRVATAAERDGMWNSGMQWGMRQSWDRLAEEIGGAAVGPQTPWAREIVISRVLAAPRDLLWRMWTEPERVERWWGPHGFRTTVQEMDVRPGGKWRMVMRGPDGTGRDNELVYQEVVRPERLVYVHTVPPVFRQEVALTALGAGRTRVAVRSSFERAEDVQPYAVEGLGQSMQRLEGTAAAEPAG